MGSISGQPPPDNRAIFFFDIDNCLYSKSTDIHAAMAALIQKFVITHLNLSADDARTLHHQYYKDYGLAIEGLSRFHKIDPMTFNREVDDALPLDDLLKPDPEVRRVLERIDRTKVKLWLFTNAHITHGQRVVKILGVEDLFEGITFCDYRQSPIIPKPKTEMFEKAEREAGVTDATTIYYVDDSYINCVASYARGWHNSVHLVEEGTENPVKEACKFQIAHLKELLDLFPELLREDKSS